MFKLLEQFITALSSSPCQVLLMLLSLMGAEIDLKARINVQKFFMH